MTQQPPAPGLPVWALNAYAMEVPDMLVTAGVTGTAVHVDVYGTHAAGAGGLQTGEPVCLHEVMQLVVVAFLQWRFAFLTHRWAFARGVAGQEAVAVAMHADIASPQTVWQARHARGVAAHDAPAAR